MDSINGLIVIVKTIAMIIALGMLVIGGAFVVAWRKSQLQGKN